MPVGHGRLREATEGSERPQGVPEPRLVVSGIPGTLPWREPPGRWAEVDPRHSQALGSVAPAVEVTGRAKALPFPGLAFPRCLPGFEPTPAPPDISPRQSYKHFNPGHLRSPCTVTQGTSCESSL